MAFVNLHQHSAYSNASTVLDSIIKVEDIAPTAFQLGWSGVALTDHNIMGGHLKFLNSVKKLREEGQKELKNNPRDLEAKRKADFKPILGVEIYLAQEGQSRETHQRGDRFYHFLLVAKDRIGWEQLNKLSQLSWGRMYKMGVTRMPNYISDLAKVVGENPGHLVATSACLGSPLGTPIQRFPNLEGEERENTKQFIIGFIETMKGIFGEEDFYLEIQPNQDPEQLVYNEGLIAFAKHTNTKLIVALDAHYKFESDREIHKAYLNSQDDVERETDRFYKYTYMMEETEIRTLLGKHLQKEIIDQAIQATMEVYNKVEVYDITHSPIIPKIPFQDKDKWANVIHIYDNYEYFNVLSHSTDNDKFLIYKTILGLHDKVEKGWLELTPALERLNEELQQVYEVSQKLKQDMSTYFTTFQAIVDEIWNISIVAPGRGSAGAFLLNFVLNITQINPLPFNFPMKRFLAAEKVSLADIDIDSSSSKKNEILKHLAEWGLTFNTDIFGIATYGTEKSKSAILTAARGLGYDPEEGLYWASLIPSTRGFLWGLKECYYGNGEDKLPIKDFIEEMNNHPDVWRVAQEIEGLVNKRSSHAAGVVFCNDFNFFKNTSVMKTPNGSWVTQYDLSDLEYLGPTKYDLLSTKAIDSIQTELLLLAENGYIEWQGSLRETYNKYLHPSRLDFEDPRIWEKINKKEVLSLFQFLDAQAGIQAIESVQPTDLKELADINSVLRLMAADGKEPPLVVYKHRKENPRLWYSEMNLIGLTPEEVKILEDHVGDTKGMCITQEQLMALVQDPRISGFTFSEADYVRKVIGKKKMKEIPKVHEKFTQQGLALGNREVFLSYIWDELFAVQLGYAFSIIHTISYSIIALQEAVLNVEYPPIFWAVARLLVESSSIDFMEEDLEFLAEEVPEDEEEEASLTEDEKKGKSVNYFKMSAAMGEVRSFGVKILPPNINKSSFSFRADVEENAIYFGLKGISRIGDNVIRDIISKRPFVGLQDFLNRVKVNKIQATMLIKAGAFDTFGDRSKMLYHYCESVADTKKTLNMRNMQMLVEQGFIPEEMKYYSQLFRFNKYLRANAKYGDMFVVQPQDAEFLTYFDFNKISIVEGSETFSESDWKRHYDKEMLPMKEWIKNNLETLLDEVNKKAIQTLVNKYAKGNIAKQEMEALSYYYSYHELSEPEYSGWLNELDVVNFFDLPEEPIVDYEKNGRKYFRLYRIAGTSIGRDKMKHIVGLETVDGFLKAKLYRSTFLKFDKQIKLEGMRESSWFGKGEKLLLTGYRSGDQFIVKTYYGHQYGQAIYKITAPGQIMSTRLGE